MKEQVSVNLVVEGYLDELVVRRILSDLNIDIIRVFGKRGKAYILEKLKDFNSASKFLGLAWIVLVDLDNDSECAPPFIRKYMRKPAEKMLFRVAVHEIESWLLADREEMASFLRVSPSLLPKRVEKEKDPKNTLINLARKSTKRSIIEDMVPPQGTCGKQGPGYASLMGVFITKHWRPTEAARNSESLRRFLKAVTRLESLSAK